MERFDESFGPCLCGADDCPRCYPGCNDPVTCVSCGGEWPAHEACDYTVVVSGKTYCNTCARGNMERKAHELADWMSVLDVADELEGVEKTVWARIKEWLFGGNVENRRK